MEIGTWRHGDRERACEEWRPREEWWEGRLLRPRGGEFSWGLRFCQWLSLSLCTPSRTSLLLLSLASRTPPLPTPHESHQLSPFPFSSFLSLSNALFVFFQNVNVRTGGLKWGISIFITVWGKKVGLGVGAWRMEWEFWSLLNGYFFFEFQNENLSRSDHYSYFLTI